MREGRWLHGAVLRPHRALQRGEKMEKDEHPVYIHVYTCMLHVCLLHHYIFEHLCKSFEAAPYLQDSFLGRLMMPTLREPQLCRKSFHSAQVTYTLHVFYMYSYMYSTYIVHVFYMYTHA